MAFNRTTGSPVFTYAQGLPTSLRPEMRGIYGATWWVGKGGLEQYQGGRETGLGNKRWITESKKSSLWGEQNTTKLIEGKPIPASYVPFSSSSGMGRNN